MTSPAIISASRRTDIPAYYSEWFMNRIRAGCVTWANPFSGKLTVTSLRAEDVAALVLVSKNYGPLVPHLDELDRMGHHAIFHFTITGLPRVLEPNVPGPEVTVPVAHELAGRYTPDAVLWRYDPIIISSVTPAEYHIKRFRELAAKMEGASRRCYISFVQFYAKVIRNTGPLESDGIVCRDPQMDEKTELSQRLAEIAEEHGIHVYSCCSEALASGRVRKGSCVDAGLLLRLYPERMRAFRLRPTRKGCGCYESTDIGAYDTCPHGCVYCYANTNHPVAERRWREHRTDAERLTG